MFVSSPKTYCSQGLGKSRAFLQDLRSRLGEECGQEPVAQMSGVGVTKVSIFIEFRGHLGFIQGLGLQVSGFRDKCSLDGGFLESAQGFRMHRD